MPRESEIHERNRKKKRIECDNSYLKQPLCGTIEKSYMCMCVLISFNLCVFLNNDKCSYMYYIHSFHCLQQVLVYK